MCILLYQLKFFLLKGFPYLDTRMQLRSRGIFNDFIPPLGVPTNQEVPGLKPVFVVFSHKFE